jgi:hypothetical protein
MYYFRHLKQIIISVIFKHNLYAKPAKIKLQENKPNSAINMGSKLLIHLSKLYLTVSIRPERTFLGN